jgi:methionyl-tRNA formyltransferase
MSTLEKYETGRLKLTPQDHEAATYCKKIDKSMGQLDFSKNAEELFYLWK